MTHGMQNDHKLSIQRTKSVRLGIGKNMHRLKGIVFFLLFIMSPLFIPALKGQGIVTPSLKAGPFLDRIQYKVIPDEDQQVLALLDNQIDLIGSTINTSYFESLSESNDIQTEATLRNGYGYLSINCAKYPFNISAFRSAFAFALDKERISEEVWNGFSVPLDSCVPKINPFSIEGTLDYSYYDSDIDLGNEILDKAGFIDVDDDDFREAPDGTDFDVVIDVAESSDIAVQIGEIAQKTLNDLGIDAISNPIDFYEYLNYRLRPWFGNYDMVFLGSSFSNFDVDWLAYEFWSAYADEPYWNFPRWRNSTYDSWRDQLLHATTYEEVYEAAIEMQKIWVYDCPMVMCYENYLLSAYRTDRFEGFVNDVSNGVPGWWTNYKTRLATHLGGPYGGSLRWGTPLDIDAFNFMVSASPNTINVLEMLYDSLIRTNPEGNDIPWLAESYTIETHDDNPAIANGTTRMVFTILQNSTWSDGTPITASDVAYTMNYYRDAQGNPYGADLAEMTAAYTRSPYEAVFEFSTVSYWHLHTIGYKPILPVHIFQDVGLDGWNTWDPNPPDEPMVTSGPFNISGYTPDESIELSINENYFFASHVTNQDDSSGTSNTTSSQDLFSLIPPQHLFVTIPSIAIIVLVSVKWKIDHQPSQSSSQ